MTEISVWKRVGGWLRRSQEPVKEGKLERLDPEGLLVDSPQEHPQQHPSALVARNNKKDKQLAALEDGFARLVEVLESINDNVLRQQEQGAAMKNCLEKVSQSLQALPDAHQSSLAVKELTDELRSQALRHQQVTEIIKKLPDLTQTQVDKLTDISRHLETSADADVQLVESFHHLDKSLQGLQDNSSDQTITLHHLQAAAQENNQNLARILAKQTRRLLALLLIITILALAALAAIIIFVQQGSNPGSA